jgi:cell wall assembly regulator SMI1
MQKSTEAPHADLAALDETVLATAARWYGNGPAIVRQGNWSAFNEEDYRMVIKCSGRNYVVYDRLYQSNAERRPQYLISTDPGTVNRCVLYIASQRYRKQQGLPSLRLEDYANEGFNGRTVSPEGIYPTVIEGSRGGVPYSAAFSFRNAARAFTHYAAVPLDKLVESLQAPDGRPLFPLVSQPPTPSSTGAAATVRAARDYIPAPDPGEALPVSGKRLSGRLAQHYALLCRAKSGLDAIRLFPPLDRISPGPEELVALRALGDGQERSPESTPLFGDFWYLPESELAGRGEELMKWHQSTATRNRNRHPDDRLQPSMFDAGWIPFAAASDGEVLAVDTNPGPEGDAGQLVSSGDRIDHEPTYRAPSLSVWLERQIRLLHADCSYWELGDNDDGSEDSLRPMVTYLSRFLRVAAGLPEPEEGKGRAEAIAAVVPYLELLGVQVQRLGDRSSCEAGEAQIQWYVPHNPGAPAITVTDQSGKRSFLRAADAARFILSQAMSALRHHGASEAGRLSDLLLVPRPLPHEIAVSPDEESLYVQYGNQPLKEIIGYYGLPLFREGQMYGAYEPGD